MIKIENITKNYKSHPLALQNLSFEIHENEIFGIIGESGAGKSTLLRLLLNLEQPSQGSILIRGKAIQDMNKKEIHNLRQDMSCVFQDYQLLMNRTVFENVALPLRLKNMFDAKKVEESLRFLDLWDKRKSYPSELSGGQKQRLAIARAIVIQPKILICDEPSSALDIKTSNEIIEILLRINEKFNTTIVIVTHELHLAKSLCDRVAILEQGQVKEIVSVKKSNTINNFETYAQEAKAVLSL